MNAIEKIKAKLAAYPDVRYSERPNRIDVHPKDQSGFAVRLQITTSGFSLISLTAGTKSSRLKTKHSLLRVWALAEMPPRDRSSRLHAHQMGGRKLRERGMEARLRNWAAPAAVLAVRAS
jgi:hypothetical protein